MMIPSGEYRAWVGEVDEVTRSVYRTPKTFRAIKPLLALESDEYYNTYSTREMMSELVLGFNEALEQDKLWAIVCLKGEEPIEGQLVQLRNLASMN